MPRIDFRKIESLTSFSPVPEGEYTCRVSDVEPDSTRAGDDMWKLRLVIQDGEHKGRILFDNLIFSPKAMPRLKIFCAACRLDVDSEVDLEPDTLMGRMVRVTTFIEEYNDDHGVAKARNKIPFDGYRPVEIHDDDLPF